MCFGLFVDSRTIIGRFNGDDRTFPYCTFVLMIGSDLMQPIISFMLMVVSLSRSYTTDTHYATPVLQKNNQNTAARGERERARERGRAGGREGEGESERETERVSKNRCSMTY